MKHIKSKADYIKENYMSDLGDKLQNAKDEVVTDINKKISDNAKGAIVKGIVKAGAKHMGGFPQEEMEKFISYIKSNCHGEVITLDKIKELVAPMLRFGVGLSADRARTTAIPTDNIDFVALISELIYSELEKRGELDCTVADEIEAEGGEEEMGDDESGAEEDNY